MPQKPRIMRGRPGDEPSQNLVDYALALLLLAVLLIISLILLGPSLGDLLQETISAISA